MDFIFMLTQQDRTVGDCLAVLEEVAPLGLRHIGFKDIGVDFSCLQALHGRIKTLGGLSYLEVVSTSPAAALDSARMAVALGVDFLLGGTQVAAILEILAGTGVAYCPFPGFPSGHPTRLGGDAAKIEQDCRQFVAAGCAGADLLAYRATEAEPMDLVRAARAGLGRRRRLICAGDVDSPARIVALRAAGCDAFTAGSAVFGRKFAPGVATLTGQLQAILACV
jgi:hypothetical protein